MPNTWEADVNLGKGTKWCTADSREESGKKYYDQYLREGGKYYVVINNDVEITVLDIKGDQVKIGITAPKSVPVYRKEVYLQIQEENKAAISVDSAEIFKNLLG